MKTLKNVLLILFFIPAVCFGQDDGDMKTYSNFTFFYLDNSSGYQADEMNFEMTDALKVNMKKLVGRPDNYFFMYGCNGQEPKISNDLNNLLEGTMLKKYLAKDSKESNYLYDRSAMRENLVEYPVRIKQNVDINLYLSAYAVKRMMKYTDELPTPPLFINEILVYLHNKELKVKVNIFINKEIADELGEEKIKNYFTFCSDQLGMQKIQPVFSFL